MLALTDKAERVLDSCVTSAQLSTAVRFCERVMRTFTPFSLGYHAANFQIGKAYDRACRRIYG